MEKAKAKDAKAVADWLVAQFAQRLKKEPADIDRKAALTAFDLDSLEAVEIVAQLETWLGRPLEPTLLWRYANIEVLAEALAAASGKPL